MCYFMGGGAERQTLGASGALLGGEKEFLLPLLPYSLFEFFYLLTLGVGNRVGWEGGDAHLRAWVLSHHPAPDIASECSVYTGTPVPITTRVHVGSASSFREQ
jgi:hypothetical protein